jgi:hypothetical protein
MSERRYSDEEVAAIFKWASESQQTKSPSLQSGDGMTLAELEEIGRDVGISSERLVAASKAIGLAWRPSARHFMGLPVGVGLSVELNRKLSEAEWERFVADLRETFDARGKVKSEGSVRQWTNGNLHVFIEPCDNGDRVRFRTVKGDAQNTIILALALFVFAAIMAIATMARHRFIPVGPFLALSALGTAGIAMFAYFGIQLPQWARLRAGQMEKLARRLALKEGRPA